MRVYTHSHRFYCGIDLHARSLHLCILDPHGTVVLDKNIAARPETLLKAIAPFRDDLVLGAECMYAWYWAIGTGRTPMYWLCSRKSAARDCPASVSRYR